MAAKKGQIEVLNKLRDWAKEILIQEELKSMFLACDKFKRTAWHMAAEKGRIAAQMVRIEVLHKLNDWAKNVITQEELKNMFLGKVNFKRTAWHMAA
jgi:precorrin-6B methylase 2